MVSRRFLAVFLALGVSVVPLHVQAGSGEFLENTGVACLVGGALVGTAALFVAPAAVVTVAGTSVMPTAVSAGASAMFGCGIGATSTLAYYGYKWIDDALFQEPLYPTLYPLREQLQSDTGAVPTEGR
jgi:hypothetical protein